MTAVTVSEVKLCESGIEMARRFIAAFTLLVTTGWAGLLPAPMFAVHVLGIVAAPAAHDDTAPSQRCCPGFKAVTVLSSLQLSSGGRPGAESHRCCFGQAPQSAPASAKESHNASPDLCVVQAEAAPVATGSQGPASATLEPDRSPPAVRGIILRI